VQGSSKAEGAAQSRPAVSSSHDAPARRRKTRPGRAMPHAVLAVFVGAC
jgi:hypothetical protein